MIELFLTCYGNVTTEYGKDLDLSLYVDSYFESSVNVSGTHRHLVARYVVL